MSTIALLRTTYLNFYLKRTDGDPTPWTDADCNQCLTDSMGDLWPDLGLKATGIVATSAATDRYTIPGSIVHVTRIDVEASDTSYLDTVTKWRYFPDADPPTKVIIAPKLTTGYNLRFYGFKPFLDAATDLLPRLENVVASLAASKAYGILASSLVNSQRQQGLDSGRVVDYQTAVGLSAYWRREYENAKAGDPNLVTNAPRASMRR
jgi:hypothetical protein